MSVNMYQTTWCKIPEERYLLNPAELIWVQIKNDVAARNIIFKIVDIENFLTAAINRM
jgi:hypothetical protein